MREFALLILVWGFIAMTPAGLHAGRMVTDPVGRTVQVPDDPMRVVALAPNVTEIVFALQQQHRLVGVTRYSDYPEQARTLPRVGSYIYLDAERIAALEPDLCIGIRDGNPIAVIRQLEAFGIPVFAVDPIDLATVMESILAMGDLLGAPTQARAVVADMQQRMDAVAARIAGAVNRPRVFFQIGVSPIVSVGSNTFIDQLITLAGGVNAAAGTAPYPRFSVEQVIALAPEVMVISSMDRTAVFEQVRDQWRQWPAIPAVRRQAVFIAPTNVFDRPTPRLVDGLELLARFIHPLLFEESP
jgi:iron complex transport system substrate-binding protein